MTPSPNELLDLLDRMIEQQQRKVYTMASGMVPGITLEETRNAHDFKALREDWIFNFEDGILAGLISARMAINAEINPVSTVW